MASADPGVTLAMRSGCVLATVSARRNRLQALERRVHDMFGLRLPAAPKCVSADAHSFLWAGAGQWLAMANGEDGTVFERRLRADLGDLASISDQSDGRIIIRVGGTCAREALAKGVPVDLHPRRISPGRCRRYDCRLHRRRTYGRSTIRRPTNSSFPAVISPPSTNG